MNTKNRLIERFLPFLRIIDANLLLYFSLFLAVFIPLFPKIPLAELIPGYIVRLRTEDVVIAVGAVIFGIQLLRRKVSLKTPLTKWIIAYLIVGLLSSIFAIIWTKTVPANFAHVSKLFLHLIRRVEYFSVFFIFYAAIRTKKHAIWVLLTFLFTTLTVSIYGVGQKYLYWPVYSTMNREFSKGLRLFLTEHARVQSTFGGHYDFAAFLVMGLMISIIGMFYVRRRWVKMVSVATFFLSLWSLMMTSSRSSFLAYLLAITMFALWMMKKSIKTGMLKFVGLYFFTFSFLFLFGDLSERFAQIFQGNEAYQAMVSTVDKVKENSFKPLVEPPKDGISIDDVNKAAEEAAKRTTVPVIVSSDTQPTPVKPADLPPDVFEDIPDAIISTKSAEGKDIEIIIPRVFSENAHRLGLSAAIRLDTLWPFAIRGFLRNPLFGSGYSTLTKYTIEQFTEAESTDNDFLRTLGETGLLGFITFYGVFVVLNKNLLRLSKHSADPFSRIIAIGMLSITAGLFVNAVYIDVFVSSKVIETYWALAAVCLRYVMFSQESVTGSSSSSGSFADAFRKSSQKQKRKLHAKA
ncbi:MAG: O-antigen polymerase [Microgenomates group bacterium GW2011_GWF2_45_18]|nr:MAG: O-antigen polymerase [Microgenomates group bacterium GW2011_GWF1_44_10]KKU02334.1 MAG: O-antigen polymerase [Microgenomates group bacterium GW2011_GWF2_45_18]HAX01729.1 hypothetical protein [Candidatus Paceibacterota bacterium]